MRIKVIVFVVLCVLFGGCANIGARSGVFGEAILCSPFPYNSTYVVWNECICAPFKVSKKNGWDGMWYALATITWPFWVVDEVFEVCLDTLFLPVDGIYLMVKE